MLLHWKHVLGVLAGGGINDVTAEIPVVTSLCYYALCAIIGRVFRAIIKTRAPAGSKVQTLLYDFVTTFQLMAMSLENGQLRIHYGDTAYVIALFSTGLWSFYTIHDGLANPCGCVIDVIKGCYGYVTAMQRIIVQLCAALLSYQYARLFWSLGLTTNHWARYNLVHCRSDLTVTSRIGFIIEFSATFLNTMMCFNTFSNFKHSENLSKCLFNSYLTLLGIDLTGMYLNPVNATNQTFGCHGPWVVEFIVVYWIAPLSATALAVRVQNELQKSFKNMYISFRSTNKDTGSDNDHVTNDVEQGNGVIQGSEKVFMNGNQGYNNQNKKQRKWTIKRQASKRK